MKPALKTFSLAVATATFLRAGTVAAERPANLADTTWRLQTKRCDTA